MVTSNTEIVRPEILPSEPPFSSFTTAEIIETNTSGMITIFSKPT
ncbi:hypothetical protein D030_1450 [Vibrio parahaemolyticus AQ3810]|nr:hypothetical protein D030_1450 [Vibrio parahaemolyticus AQ3810]